MLAVVAVRLSDRERHAEVEANEVAADIQPGVVEVLALLRRKADTHPLLPVVEEAVAAIFAS